MQKKFGAKEKIQELRELTRESKLEHSLAICDDGRLFPISKGREDAIPKEEILTQLKFCGFGVRGYLHTHPKLQKSLEKQGLKPLLSPWINLFLNFLLVN
jgi:hypothetical protein